MKTWSILLLSLGALLFLTGILFWQLDNRNVANKLAYVVFPFLPAWSLIVMGWTGLAVNSVSERLREKDQTRSDYR
jgi:hypothetical protein